MCVYICNLLWMKHNRPRVWYLHFKTGRQYDALPPRVSEIMCWHKRYCSFNTRCKLLRRTRSFLLLSIHRFLLKRFWFGTQVSGFDVHCTDTTPDRCIDQNTFTRVSRSHVRDLNINNSDEGDSPPPPPPTPYHQHTPGYSLDYASSKCHSH